MTFTALRVDEITAATAKFSAEVTDPKASFITTYNFLAGPVRTLVYLVIDDILIPSNSTRIGVSLLLFHDGPSPPPGIFDDFLDVNHFTSDVKTRDFLDLVNAAPSDATAGHGMSRSHLSNDLLFTQTMSTGIFNTVPLLEPSPAVISAVVKVSHYFWLDDYMFSLLV